MCARSGFDLDDLIKRKKVVVNFVRIERHEAIHAAGLKPYLDCDGCLLLGDEPDLLEIADYMEASGKKIWREISDIPAA
jgi:hypothetical protein